MPILNSAVQRPDLDALGAHDVDQRATRVMSRCTGNHVGVWRLGLPGLQRVLRLHVEVLYDEIREHRRELQRRQHAGLHVVRVVAAREVLDAVRRNRNAAIPLAGLTAAAPGRTSVRLPPDRCRAPPPGAAARAATAPHRARAPPVAVRPAAPPAPPRPPPRRRAPPPHHRARRSTSTAAVLAPQPP